MTTTEAAKALREALAAYESALKAENKAIKEEAKALGLSRDETQDISGDLESFSQVAGDIKHELRENASRIVEQREANLWISQKDD